MPEKEKVKPEPVVIDKLSPAQAQVEIVDGQDLIINSLDKEDNDFDNCVPVEFSYIGKDMRTHRYIVYPTKNNPLRKFQISGLTNIIGKIVFKKYEPPIIDIET